MNKLEELDIWLSGLEEVLGTDWAPSREQWKVIRAKIKSLAATQNSPQFTARVTVPADGLFTENPEQNTSYPSFLWPNGK